MRCRGGTPACGARRARQSKRIERSPAHVLHTTSGRCDVSPLSGGPPERGSALSERHHPRAPLRRSVTVDPRRSSARRPRKDTSMTLETTRPLNEVDLAAVGGLAQAVADEPANGATVWKRIRRVEGRLPLGGAHPRLRPDPVRRTDRSRRHRYRAEPRRAAPRRPRELPRRRLRRQRLGRWDRDHAAPYRRERRPRPRLIPRGSTGPRWIQRDHGVRAPRGRCRRRGYRRPAYGGDRIVPGRAHPERRHPRVHPLGLKPTTGWPSPQNTARAIRYARRRTEESTDDRRDP